MGRVPTTHRDVRPDRQGRGRPPLRDHLGAPQGKAAAKKDTDLGAPELKAIVAEFKALYRQEVGEDFPEDPMHQLRESVGAVFRSWNGKRAVDYRTFNKIPHHLGTAANVQMMVFGNMGSDSGTGVAFTRNQVTGAKELYGEYLPNAQ